MNALQPNAETGFLESPGHGSTFDSNLKLEFLRLANEYFDKTGNMPDQLSLCKAISIHPRTLENHLVQDQAFSEAWRSIRLKGKWKLESKMYEYAQNKGGYMHMITWLRKEFPEEYNPDIKVINTTDFTWLKKVNEVLSVDKPAIIATDAVITSSALKDASNMNRKPVDNGLPSENK